MDDQIAVAERAEDEIEAQDPGSTVALGPEGWEASAYMDPDDDWSLMPDGSYLSSDGMLRTWPHASPEPG
jgi:hypothetical protein